MNRLKSIWPLIANIHGCPVRVSIFTSFILKSQRFQYTQMFTRNSTRALKTVKNAFKIFLGGLYININIYIYQQVLRVNNIQYTHIAVPGRLFWTKCVQTGYNKCNAHTETPGGIARQKSWPIHRCFRWNIVFKTCRQQNRKLLRADCDVCANVPRAELKSNLSLYCARGAFFKLLRYVFVGTCSERRFAALKPCRENPKHFTEMIYELNAN